MLILKKVFSLFLLILIINLTGCKKDDIEIKQAFDESGKLKWEYTYKNGVRHGPSITYYENGQIAGEVNFVDGKMEGLFRAYYETGEVKMEAVYKNGLLDGEVKAFFIDGKLESLKKYEKNKMVYNIKYDYEGNVEYEDFL